MSNWTKDKDGRLYPRLATDADVAADDSVEEEGCAHSEVDHYMCCDCGKEFDPGEAIDRAMDHFKYRD